MVADYRDLLIRDLSDENLRLRDRNEYLEQNDVVLRAMNSELLAAYHDAIKDDSLAFTCRQRAAKQWNHDMAKQFAVECYAEVRA